MISWLRVLFSRLVALFRKGRMERALDEELRSHLEMQIEENRRRGMSLQDARYAALRSFGGVEQVKEIYRETLSSFFGALALMLAALGLYGTLAHLVAQKTREIGIRMALGAQRSDVFRLLIGEAAWPVLIGVFVGLAAALAASRIVTSMLFGLTATNPVVLIISIAVLLATAALAACLPARLAAKVDPIVALRCE